MYFQMMKDPGNRRHRADKNKNRQQRDGTPVGKKIGCVKRKNSLAFAWQAAQQMRTETSLSARNRFDVLDTEDDNQPNTGGNVASTSRSTYLTA